MSLKFVFLTFGLITIMQPMLASAEELSNVAYIHRCYAHLTGIRMPYKHPYLLQVRSGTLSAEDACKQLLDDAELDAQGMLYSDAAANAVKVSDAALIAQNLLRINRDKFRRTDFCAALDNVAWTCQSNSDIFDTNTSGLALTEVLLTSSSQRRYGDILKFSTVPRALRVLDEVTYPAIKQGSAVAMRKRVTSSSGNEFLMKSPSTAWKAATSEEIVSLYRFPDIPVIDGATIINKSGTEEHPTYGILNRVLSTYPISEFADFSKRIQIGTLVGIQFNPNWGMRFPASESMDPYYKRTDGVMHEPLDLRRTIDQSLQSPTTEGSGIIGSQEYLQLNFGWDQGFDADGSLKMPRRWAESVYKDLLCRDLPVLRVTDIKSFMWDDPSLYPNAAPFRASTSCVACHGAMDQMAGSIRNYTWKPRWFNHFHIAKYKDGLLDKTITTSAWLNQPYSSPEIPYHLRKPVGRLFFRSYDGTLVDKPVVGVKEMSHAIAETNDFYVCAVAQYFKQFTGYHVSLHDMGDPANSSLNSGMSSLDWEKRNWVVEKGLELKKNGRIRDIVKDILTSKYFKSRTIERGNGG